MKRIPKRKTLSKPYIRTFGIPPTERNIPKVFKKSLIGGKKPKGWETRRSRYRISFKAEYKITTSGRTFYKPGKRHYLTISNAVFSGANYRNGYADLESESLNRVNKYVEIWKQKELEGLDHEYPSESGYSVSYHRAGSSWRIYRVG